MCGVELTGVFLGSGQINQKGKGENRRRLEKLMPIHGLIFLLLNDETATTTARPE